MFASNLARSFQIFFIYTHINEQDHKNLQFFCNRFRRIFRRGGNRSPDKDAFPTVMGPADSVKLANMFGELLLSVRSDPADVRKRDAGGRKVSSRTEKPCPSLISGPAIAGIPPIWEFPNRFLPIPAAAIWRSFWKRDGCRKSRGAPTEDSGGGNG
ncbi:hypothetical protein Cdeb_01820 [Caldibacillus debilis GB1]|uniref:Uncharacterized protein n=1 Tax=Caldibacillus debilis GB1 TaxID=1339248 RepID=A0A420VC54_9BACI|nr:hypothetical protein Cdeb_01820 [Caldibacillus debilis GB1]